jgi:hypothetical protein
MEKSSFSRPVTSRFIGSVTVTGTRTMSTFIRMTDPGFNLPFGAAVIAGASTPAGAPTAGAFVVEGGGTWTLFRGSSWEDAVQVQKAASARAHTKVSRRLRNDPRNASERWRSSFMGLHQRWMMAILARPGKALRFSTDALGFFDVAFPKSVIRSAVQSTVSDGPGCTSTQRIWGAISAFF